MSRETLKRIKDAFEDLTVDEATVNLTVMVLHDITGVKKRDIKKLLKYGPKVYEVYDREQTFEKNKSPKAKVKK